MNLIKIFILLASTTLFSQCRTITEQSDLEGQVSKTRICDGRPIYNPKPTGEHIQHHQSLGDAKLLINNTESWWKRWEIVSKAKKNIHVQYFILQADEYGYAFLGLLLAKRLEGVNVRIMLDGRGSAWLTKPLLGRDYMQELVEHGVEVIVYNPTIASVQKIEKIFNDGISAVRSLFDQESLQQIANGFMTLNTGSNHDKMIIVDDEEIILGGRNISQAYFDAIKNPSIDAHDDMDIWIKSRSVAASGITAYAKEANLLKNATIGKDFYNWTSRKEALLSAKENMDHRYQAMLQNGKSSPEDWVLPIRRNIKMSLLDNTSALNREICVADFIHRHPEDVQVSTSLFWAMQQSREHIWIINPYIVLTPELLRTFDAVRERNVPIYIITNSILSANKISNGESFLTQALFMNEWESILKKYPNIRFFITKGPAKIHSKAFVFDGKTSMVSSYNLDYISQNINSEIAAYIDDSVFSQDLLKYLQNFTKAKTIEIYLKDGKGIYDYNSLTSDYEIILQNIERVSSFARAFRERL